MNEQLVLIAIGAIAAAFILRPLIRGRGTVAREPRPKARAAPSPPPAANDELTELELDRAMGRVSEADFLRWRDEIAIDASVPSTAPPRPATLPNDAESNAEALVRKWRAAPRPACPNCGERPEPEARYCSNCGASLTA